MTLLRIDIFCFAKLDISAGADSIYADALDMSLRDEKASTEVVLHELALQKLQLFDALLYDKF